MALPEDVELKLRHARSHLQTLNAQFGSFGDRDPYSVVTEIDRYAGDRGRVRARMKINREPLREWSLTIGDCAQNLRAALDYAALALWRANSGEPDDGEIDQVGFPIYTEQRRYRLNRHRKIGGLHYGAKRLIRLMQPYQRRDDPHGHLLQVLHGLNNHDKHRFLHITHAVTQDAKIEILERENILITDNPSPRVGGFEDGDEIASLAVLAISPQPKLEVKLKQTYGVAFDIEGPARGQLVAKLLNDIRVFIRDDVLKALEPYF